MDGERAARTRAEELIAELWAADPPDLLQIARPRGAVAAIEAPGTAGRAHGRLPELLCALMRLGTEAELRAVSAPPSDLPALHVLAATARSLHHLLAEARHGRPGEGDARVRDAHRRVSRMERWLAERAEHDRDAGAAADVALWVLDHLERRRG